MKKRLLLLSVFFCLLTVALNPRPAYAFEETFSPTDDSFVNSVYPDNTYGGAGVVICGRISGGAIRWPVLSFDLTSIPWNASIDSVTLKLYQNDASGLATVPLEVIILDENWDEGSVNWNEDLETYGDPIGRLDASSTAGYREWDLSAAMVESRWVETPSNNHGLILKGDYDGPSAFARTFRSKEYANAGQHPVLTVSYTPADETPPDLSNIKAQEITHDAAAITWQTDEEATSWVKYWKTEGFVTTAGQDEWTTDHRVTLWDLDPLTSYTFQVVSKDREDNEATSDEHEFTTLATASAAEAVEDKPETMEEEETTEEETEPVVVTPGKVKKGTGDKEATVSATEAEATTEGRETKKEGLPLLLTIAFILGAAVVLLALVIFILIKQKKPSKKKKEL